MIINRKETFSRWLYFLTTTLFFISSGLQAGTFDSTSIPKNKNDNCSADGPYILYQPDGSTRIIRVDEKGNIKDTVYKALPEDFRFKVADHQGKYPFYVQLRPIKRPNCKSEASEKTLVISDPHGQMDCLLSMLQGNKVIDSSLHWCYGKNQLMIIGDIFDRGKDVMAICWLFYQLEWEAEQAGGSLSFLLGNHESMVLANDLRYAKEKYPLLAEKLKLNYSELIGANTEIGRWLATRNTMHIIGTDLFVHAGLSSDFYNGNLALETVNEAMSRVLFLPTKKRKTQDELSALLYGSRGPIWYRGMVRTDAKYAPLANDTLQLLLNRYHVEHIIVGHTIFQEPQTFYQGKVIGVNVKNEENHKKQRGLGVLITRKRYYMVGDKGIMKEL